MRKHLHKKNKYQKFWRKHKKALEISIIILIILVGAIIQFTVLSIPEKLDNSPPVYCERNCIKACSSQNVGLVSYGFTDTKCQCQCENNKIAVFGIDFLEN